MSAVSYIWWVHLHIPLSLVDGEGTLVFLNYGCYGWQKDRKESISLVRTLLQLLVVTIYVYIFLKLYEVVFTRLATAPGIDFVCNTFTSPLLKELKCFIAKFE